MGVFCSALTHHVWLHASGCLQRAPGLMLQSYVCYPAVWPIQAGIYDETEVASSSNMIPTPV